LVKLAMLSIDRAIVAEEQRELADVVSVPNVVVVGGGYCLANKNDPKHTTQKQETVRGSERGKEKIEDPDEAEHQREVRPIAALVLQIHDELVYEVHCVPRGRIFRHRSLPNTQLVAD
jgi:hypothetical protein